MTNETAKVWLFGNELILNADKTYAMLLHSSQWKCVNKLNTM
jgi:hypothetical protein